MSLTKNFKFLLLCLVFGLGFCTRYDWELNQLNRIQDSYQYYSDRKFNSTDEVIKDARLVIDKWMKGNVGEIPGAIIGVSVKGKTIWTEAFGRTDIENNVTTDRNSIWRLASISKPLTSALVAHLIDRNLLNLDKHIDEYLPKSVFPSKTFEGKEVNITLRQLLSHTAGLHLTDVDEDLNSVFLAANVSQMLDRFKDEKLLFRPGTGFSYSNYGFQILGAIIESVVNNTFQNEMKKFYNNLEMKQTFAETRRQIFEHRPRYYTPSNDTTNSQHLVNTGMYDDLLSYEGWWPSGGMVSTIDDILTFGNEMITAYKGNNKSFLSQSIVKELWTPETKGIIKAQDFGKSEYGKGWLIVDPNELIPQYPYKRLVWHSGGILGASTLLFLFPEEHVTCVVFTNMGDTEGMDQLLLYVAQNLYDFI